VPLRALTVGLVTAAVLALAGSAAATPVPGTNGRIVYVSGPGFGASLLSLRTTESDTGAGSSSPINTGLVCAVTPPPNPQHRHPTWSPDRTKIAFSADPNCGTKYDIYTLDLTNPNATPVNITNTPAVKDDRPAWSPDGTRIAYESDNDIIVHPLNGGSDVNMTTNITPPAFKAAWSPDSNTLYYGVGDINVAPNGTTTDIRLFQQSVNNATGGTELLHVPNKHVMQPAISPDGSKICYGRSTAATTTTPNQEIVAAPLSNPGSITTIADGNVGDYTCAWSPDGTLIAYTEGFGNNAEMLMTQSDGQGAPVDLTNAPGNFEGSPDWAPDGRPACPDPSENAKTATPLEFEIICNDTGPEYEQTNVREFPRTQPAHGKLTQDSAGDPFTYTSDAGFEGTDSFKVGSFDTFGFGGDGTVTISVKAKLHCGHKPVTIFGTPAGETLIGTNGPDVIAALGGKDKIRGKGGKDIICAGGGNDSVDAGGGNDLVFGQGGNDSIKGGSGRDTLNGGSGKDKLRGESGRDKLNGNSGRDSLDGGKSRDRCNGGSGRDHGKRCEIRTSIP
jgi:Ca2+-binding RTX toxin-like protein